MKKSIMVLMVLVLFASVNIASANIFTDVLSKLVPHQQPVVVNTQSTTEDNFSSFMSQMYQLNTPTNIQILNSQMQKYETQAIKIHVTDYDKDFYVVQGHGVLKDYPTSDREFMLSKTQIERIKGYIEGGKVTPYKWFRIWLIYKNL